ncbi:MAG: class I SAM-dependent methyltransferase [Alphaproteobacteria bacterium]
MPADVLRLLREHPPFIHVTGSGERLTWSLSREILEFLDREVRDGMSTLETGAGASTIVFAAKGALHRCIVPDQKQVDRIKSYCSEHGIAVGNVDFVIDRSERALPKLVEHKYDLVLIDGGHAFPVPFIDFAYTSDRLAVGGVLIVDDTQIWTGDALYRFLRRQPGWAPIKLTPRTAIFRKTAEQSLEDDWLSQPFIVSASRPLMIRMYALEFARLVVKGEFARALRGTKKILGQALK